MKKLFAVLILLFVGLGCFASDFTNKYVMMSDKGQYVFYSDDAITWFACTENEDKILLKDDIDAFVTFNHYIGVLNTISNFGLAVKEQFSEDVAYYEFETLDGSTQLYISN